MENNRKYKILEYATTGWEVVVSGLSYDEAKHHIDSYISDGVNPSYLKVESETDESGEN